MPLPFSIPFQWIKPALHALDAETAHSVTVNALKAGLYPKLPVIDDPRLHMTLWDRKFPNPVGLAAGFEKKGEVIKQLFDLGFGFIEAGTVTPKPQSGNPRPRIFRDAGTESVINRMGFPSDGLNAFKDNIQKFLDQKPRASGLVGLNIGMNKTQKEPEKDYRLLIRALGSYADYFTINISSPNTPGLRNLQSAEHLAPLIDAVYEERGKSCSKQFPPPLLIKLAPDLSEQESAAIAQVFLDKQIDGIILTNTTLERPQYLPGQFSHEKGGLSGQPLTDQSTRMIRRFYDLTRGTIPIIGVGGISNAAQAYEKIKAGASLVQLYSALVFHGPEIVNDINQGLLALLEKDGFGHLSDAIGTDHKEKI